MANIKEQIQEAALEIGFSKIGFARAEPLPNAPLLEWLQNGYHGDMAYMARDPEKRLDPGKVLPGCQTVIATALNYYTPYPTKSNDNQGQISRYAWGKDYHKVIQKKLKKLAAAITLAEPLAKVKVCVDTTPILEKAWAERAGLGWQGKHTNLITRDLGSWVFLGEILTDLVIEPDAPHLDFCGNCNRCIEACPTQAITAPYVVDGSRCIAYLTIETKEPIDKELSEKTGNWIFGCDVCQEVCPWNRFSSTTPEEAFFPRPQVERPLESWMEITDEEFLEEFAGTPLMRAKRKHMAQNAAIAKHNLEK